WAPLPRRSLCQGRPALAFDSSGLDRRQGDARSHDGPLRLTPRRLRLRVPHGLRDRAPPRRYRGGRRLRPASPADVLAIPHRSRDRGGGRGRADRVAESGPAKRWGQLPFAACWSSLTAELCLRQKVVKLSPEPTWLSSVWSGPPAANPGTAWHWP